MNETATAKEMETRTGFDWRNGLNAIGQVSWYLLASTCILFTFVSFGFMAFNGGRLTMDANAFGEMWYEIALLIGLAGMSGGYLWFRVEQKWKRPILALLVFSGFMLGASAYLMINYYGAAWL